MAKHHRIWNSEVFKRYLREGRGQGEGVHYKPWIFIQDFASRGMVSRVKGRTVPRVYHLMSHNELAYFYLLDWSDEVTDIQEQFPLLDLELATAIAAESGIRYPTDNRSGYPYVMTCDFMVITSNGLKARTVKLSSELSNPRVLEKLEIERRYWIKQGIDWKIVTENEIQYAKAKNIEWLYSVSENIPNELFYNNKTVAVNLIQELIDNHKHSVDEIARLVETELGLKRGNGFEIFKILAISKAITVDLAKPLFGKKKGFVMSV